MYLPLGFISGKFLFRGPNLFVDVPVCSLQFPCLHKSNFVHNNFVHLRYLFNVRLFICGLEKCIGSVRRAESVNFKQSTISWIFSSLFEHFFSVDIFVRFILQVPQLERSSILNRPDLHVSHRNIKPKYCPRVKRKPYVWRDQTTN